MIGAAMETIEPLGRFSLRAAAAFGFGPTEGRPPTFDGALRLAFCVDGGRGYAGAVLRQRDDDGAVGVELTLRDGAPHEAALAQAARTVSLDHDGEAFERVGERDPVIGALQRAHPGQRPVLFAFAVRGGGVVGDLGPAATGAGRQGPRRALPAARAELRAGRAHAARVPAAVGAGADPGRRSRA